MPGGKILVAGNAGSGSDEGSPGPVPSQFAAVRYNPDGSVDATFGAAGQAVGNYDPGQTNGLGVASTGGAAVLGNGDIVIEGSFFGSGPTTTAPSSAPSPARARWTRPSACRA